MAIAMTKNKTRICRGLFRQPRLSAQAEKFLASASEELKGLFRLCCLDAYIQMI